MSSPSTAAYLRSGELTCSLPATTQVLGRFRFVSKASGEAATTAARIPFWRPFPAAVPHGPGGRCAGAVVSLALRSPLASPATRAYTSPSALSASARAARTARAASVNEAPVVIRSSTRTIRPPASSRALPAATSRAPARLVSRCREPSPAWSATTRRCRSTAATLAAVPARRSCPAAASAIRRVGSCPRARTARRAEGTGTSSTGAGPPPAREATEPQQARTAPARAVPSGPARVSAPRSLWDRSVARTAPSYGAAAWTGGRPAGSGTGRTRRGAVPWRAARHSGQSTVRGLPQPPHSAGSTKSVRSCHHPRMATTVPTPAPACHPCGKLPVDNRAAAVEPPAESPARGARHHPG
jgi:hypothetical protein